MNTHTTQGQQVRDKILDFLKRKQVTISPVTFFEIAEEIGGASTSVVTYHLGVLEKEGKIRRDKNKARHIEVIE